MSLKKHILFIPGLLCDEYLWHNQIEAFSSDYDLTIADVTRYNTIEETAFHVLSQAPEQFTMVGLSMGGYIALEIMRRTPERVEKLVITNSSARLDTSENTKRRTDLIAMVKMAKRFKGITPRLLPMLVHEDRLKDEIFVKPIMEMAERVGREAFLNQQIALLNRPESLPSLSDINVETLIIGGNEDIITPIDHSKEMNALIPNSRLEVFDKCGHLAPLEYPERFNQILLEALT